MTNAGHRLSDSLVPRRTRKCTARGIASLLAILVVAACGSRSQVRISDVESWLPPGAVVTGGPVLSRGEQRVHFSVTSTPMAVSEGIAAYCEAQGWRKDRIPAWGAPWSGGGVLREPGRPNVPSRRWRGVWKDDDGNTISYSLETEAPDLNRDGEVFGQRLVVRDVALE